MNRPFGLGSLLYSWLLPWVVITSLLFAIGSFVAWLAESAGLPAGLIKNSWKVCIATWGLCSGVTLLMAIFVFRKYIAVMEPPPLADDADSLERARGQLRRQTAMMSVALYPDEHSESEFEEILGPDWRAAFPAFQRFTVERLLSDTEVEDY